MTGEGGHGRAWLCDESLEAHKWSQDRSSTLLFSAVLKLQKTQAAQQASQPASQQLGFEAYRCLLLADVTMKGDVW